mgnify:CR=1 FL=1
MPDYANLCPDHARALTHWSEDHRHETDEDHAERVEHLLAQMAALEDASAGRVWGSARRKGWEGRGRER